jgi:uncharacterized membrane protein YqjE
MSSQSWYTNQSNPWGNSSTGTASTNPDEERPLVELFSDLTQSVQTLLRKEVELAKVEVKEQATRAGKAGAMLAGTAVMGFFALLLLSFAAAWGLAEGIPTWLAFLAVGLIYGVVAGLLLLVGKKKLETVNPVPRQTVETLREDVEVAKSSLSRGARH